MEQFADKSPRTVVFIIHFQNQEINASFLSNHTVIRLKDIVKWPTMLYSSYHRSCNNVRKCSHVKNINNILDGVFQIEFAADVIRVRVEGSDREKS